MSYEVREAIFRSGAAGCNPRVRCPTRLARPALHLRRPHRHLPLLPGHRCLDRNPKTRISLPELLDHAFLHPNRRKPQPPPAAPAPAPPLPSGGGGMAGLTEEQIKAILQVRGTWRAAWAMDGLIREFTEG